MSELNPPNVPIIGQQPTFKLEAFVIALRCLCYPDNRVQTFQPGQAVECPKCRKHYGVNELKCVVGQQAQPGDIVPAAPRPSLVKPS